MSAGVLISVVGGLLAALLSAMFSMMMWQFSALNDRIDGLETEFRTEIATLRAEMQEDFREVHVILRDHTERLARIEAVSALQTQ